MGLMIRDEIILGSGYGIKLPGSATLELLPQEPQYFAGTVV
jgi:hypothetical protein